MSAPPAVRPVRPPYGVSNRAAHRTAADLGMTPVLWTAWGRDWRHDATSATVRRTVAKDLAGGGTVLLHDSDCTATPQAWRATLWALPGLVAEIRRRGLEPGPLRDHNVLR